MPPSLTVVCISDTHEKHREMEIPPGDLLLHAGDLTSLGSRHAVAEFNQFLGELPHRHKVVIAGNHDFAFEKKPEATRSLLTHCIYLEDEEVTIEGLRLYGSPWQPWFYDWAFNLERGPEIRAKWDLIPEGIDILMTHGPPLGHGDRTRRGEHTGCADLLDAIRRIQPRYHIFGHIHEGYGITYEGPTTLINASSCNLDYEPLQPPVLFTIEPFQDPSPR